MVNVLEFFLSVLRFYGPVNPVGTCRVWSVYGTKPQFFLGRRKRMIVENISWSIPMNECCQTRWGSNMWPPDLQWGEHPTEPMRLALEFYTPKFLISYITQNDCLIVFKPRTWKAMLVKYLPGSQASKYQPQCMLLNFVKKHHSIHSAIKASIYSKAEEVIYTPVLLHFFCPSSLNFIPVTNTAHHTDLSKQPMLCYPCYKRWWS